MRGIVHRASRARLPCPVPIGPHRPSAQRPQHTPGELDRAGACPRDDPTIVLGDDRWKALPLVELLLGDLLRSPRIGLERGYPLGDPFVVDRGDRSSVFGCRKSRRETWLAASDDRLWDPGRLNGSGMPIDYRRSYQRDISSIASHAAEQPTRSDKRPVPQP